MPLMGVDQPHLPASPRRSAAALAGLAACLLVLQYDIHPAIGLQFGPIIFLICVLGGLGNLVGGFVAAFIFAPVHRGGRLLLHARMGLRDRLPVLHRGDVLAAARDCSEPL